MTKYHFVMSAKKYFDTDADNLEHVREDDVVEVLIDPENKTAEYNWHGSDKTNANFSWEIDGYDSVLEQVLSYFG
jgi:hypothetical protein